RRGCSAKRTGQKARRTNSRCWKRSRKPPPFRASYRKREKFTLKPSSRRGEESLKRVPQALRHGRRRRKVWLEMRHRRVRPHDRRRKRQPSSKKSWIIAGYARPHRPAPCPISNWGERAFCLATQLRPARLTRTSSPFGKTPIRLFLS